MDQIADQNSLEIKLKSPRFIVIHKTKGVFLGVYMGNMIFAQDEEYPSIKACTFSCKTEAKEVASYGMLATSQYFIAQVDTKLRHIDLVDIIREGYGAYTHNMLDNLHSPSPSIH